jgi:hypothetical protein
MGNPFDIDFIDLTTGIFPVRSTFMDHVKHLLPQGGISMDWNFQ